MWMVWKSPTSPTALTEPPSASAVLVESSGTITLQLSGNDVAASETIYGEGAEGSITLGVTYTVDVSAVAPIPVNVTPADGTTKASLSGSLELTDEAEKALNSATSSAGNKFENILAVISSGFQEFVEGSLTKRPLWMNPMSLKRPRSSIISRCTKA